jgi:HEAT repeat protein
LRLLDHLTAEASISQRLPADDAAVTIGSDTPPRRHSMRAFFCLLGCAILLLAIVAAAHSQDKDKGDKEEKTFNGKTISEWARDLGSDDVGSRRTAAIVLRKAEASAHPAIKALTKALQDSDDTVRFHCIQALGNIGTSARSAVPELIKVLTGQDRTKTEQDPNILRAAAGALGKMGKDAVGPLTKVLREDESAAVRRLAATGLALIGPEASSAGPALAKALEQDTSFRVRRIAAETLRLIDPKPKEVLDALIGAIRNDLDADVCRSAAIAAGKLGKPALGELVKLLKDDNADIRFHATSALREMGAQAEPAIKSLLPLLRDKDEEVRASAAIALGAVGEPAVAVLVESLADKEPEMRRAAATGLAQVGKRAKKAVGPLIKSLKDDDSETRLAVIRALGTIGDSEAVKPLTALLSDKDSEMRRVSAVALGEIGTPAGPAAATLAGLLEDKDRPVRDSAMIALFRIGKPSVTPLREVLKKTRESDAKVLALFALGAIGEDAEEAVGDIANALKDDHADVRFYAARALGRLGSKAKSAIKALESATKDKDASVSKEARQALDQINSALELEKKD